MKNRLLYITALIFFISLLLSPFSIPPSHPKGYDEKEELNRISEDMEINKRLLEEETEAHHREREEASLVLEKLKEEIGELNNRLAELKKYKDEVDEKITSTSQGFDSLNKKAKKLSGRLINLKEKLKTLIHEAVVNIENGFPYNKLIRSAEFLILEKDIAGERSELMEGLNRFWDLLEDEISLCGESEIYPGDVPGEEAEIKGARYLRLGMVSLVYVSEDGKEVGMLTRDDDDYTWFKDLEKTHEESIKGAQQIVDGKEIFRLIDFPFDLRGIISLNHGEHSAAKPQLKIED